MTETWLQCPNELPCPHSGLAHDIWTPDDPRPICCVVGCNCGQDDWDVDDETLDRSQ